LLTTAPVDLDILFSRHKTMLCTRPKPCDCRIPIKWKFAAFIASFGQRLGVARGTYGLNPLEATIPGEMRISA
jgi:hypothetical protein